MTNHVARLYALASSLVVFFAVWVAISAHPWASTASGSAAADPQLVRLRARQLRLQAETRRVNLVVARRFATYRRALARRNHANAVLRARHARQLTAARSAALAAQRRVVVQATQAAPAPVRIVTLPAVTTTRSS